MYIIHPKINSHGSYFVVLCYVLTLVNFTYHIQRSKLLPIHQPKADKFGGLGTFLKLFFNFMFMIWDSRQQRLQLFLLSFEHCHIDGLVQERCYFSALAMELSLSCTNPSIYPSWLLHWHQSYLTTAPVPVKQPWRIRMKCAHKSTRNW